MKHTKDLTQHKTYQDALRKVMNRTDLVETRLYLGNGPAADYNKGPGNWTGD